MHRCKVQPQELQLEMYHLDGAEINMVLRSKVHPGNLARDLEIASRLALQGLRPVTYVNRVRTTADYEISDPEIPHLSGCGGRRPTTAPAPSLLPSHPSLSQ